MSAEEEYGGTFTVQSGQDASALWCVWTESGEYEQFRRELRGIFASEAVAEAHAAQLRGAFYSVVEVVMDAALDAVPTSVPYVRYAAHIWPDGTEDRDLGYHRGPAFRTWSNELRPLDSARCDPWSATDMFIEVIGSDEALVAAEYERLLVALRSPAALGEDGDR